MRFTVATYNIHKGFTQLNQRMVIHELRERLHGLSADILLLQEVVERLGMAYPKDPVLLGQMIQVAEILSELDPETAGAWLAEGEAIAGISNKRDVGGDAPVMPR